MTKRSGVEVAVLLVALANPAYAEQAQPKRDASAQQGSKGKKTGLVRYATGMVNKLTKNVISRANLAITPVHAEPGIIPAYMLKRVIRNAAKGPQASPEDKAAAKSARATLRFDGQISTKGKTWSWNRDASVNDGHLHRETYDANFVKTVPDGEPPDPPPGTPLGKLELSDTDNQTNVDAARRGHDALGVFYDLNKKLGFDAMKVAPGGGALQMIVRYAKNYDNAFFDGRHMVVGSGDPAGIFKDLTLAPDISYHEIGHGMTEYVLGNSSGSLRALRHDGRISGGQAVGMWLRAEAKQIFRGVRNRLGPGFSKRTLLNYQGQSGALNESVSDIYGAMGLQYTRGAKLGQLSERDFLIGAGSMNDSIKPAAGHPLALRNMLYPGTGFDDPRMGRDDQPADMAHMYRGFKDNGGVHINSGIPNRAWAVATTELAKVMPDKASWETTGYVWMHSMALLGPDATFAEAARATYVTAQRLFPKDPAVAQSIEKGWKTVGLNVDGKPPVSTSPSSGHPIRVIILSWLKNLKK